jgi:hypothetical protein
MWRWLSDWWFFFSTFFPVRLLLLHFRRSHFLLLAWLLLGVFITGNLGKDFGFQYLFLRPVFQEELGFIALVLLGLAAGLFTMAFHINSYIYYSYRFPFLASLSRPLLKFSINNSIIPLFFFALYFRELIIFFRHEGYDLVFISMAILSLGVGIAVSISFVFTYFLSTIKTLEPPTDGGLFQRQARSIKTLIQLGRKRRVPAASDVGVNYYLKNFWSVRITRKTAHYSTEQLRAVMDQHHFSAAMFFLLVLLLILGLNLIGESPSFQVPAGAAVFLFFTIVLMIIGAVYARLKTWTVSFSIVAIAILNYFSVFEPFRTVNYAYGMDYSGPPAQYDYPSLDQLTSDSIVRLDLKTQFEVLEAWKARQTDSIKPPMVLLNLSGGGLRSTLWTMEVLSRLDSLSNGAFFPRVHLMVGSSGGMLGAAYYRELWLRYQRGDLATKPWSSEFRRKAGKGILDPVAHTLVVNDLLLRIKKVEFNGQKLSLDRGYRFDERFLSNTDHYLDHPFSYYRDFERSASIPQLILAPTVIGDGRKLLMGNLGLSFMTFTRSPVMNLRRKNYDGVEFLRLFKEQEADSLRWVTALRMSASFPYITPLVNLPAEPGLELIDAGARDNEGLEFAIRYAHQFRSWLQENVSQLIIIHLKADRKDYIEIKNDKHTRLGELLLPIGAVVKSFSNFQIFNKSVLLSLSDSVIGPKLKIHRYTLLDDNDEVSLSWYLTPNEKNAISRNAEEQVKRETLQNLFKEE